jgi:hypothetical protein
LRCGGGLAKLGGCRTYSMRARVADASRLDRMKARGKKLKRTKRKRGVGMSFGELVRKLWQPEPDGLEPKVSTGKQTIAATKRKRARKS